jgi:hypothetical protein
MAGAGISGRRLVDRGGVGVIQPHREPRLSAVAIRTGVAHVRDLRIPSSSKSVPAFDKRSIALPVARVLRTTVVCVITRAVIDRSVRRALRWAPLRRRRGRLRRGLGRRAGRRLCRRLHSGLRGRLRSGFGRRWRRRRSRRSRRTTCGLGRELSRRPAFGLHSIGRGLGRGLRGRLWSAPRSTARASSAATWG